MSVVSPSSPVRSTIGVVPPLLELDDHLDALLLAHGADAEDRRNVDEADAADLHVVPLQLVAAADEDVAAALRRTITRSSATMRWPRSTRSSTHSDLPMPLCPMNSSPTP